MRSPAKHQGAWSAGPFLALLAIFLPGIFLAPRGGEAAEVESFEVNADPGGGVRATARLVFPGAPGMVQALLSDYPHWPDLFEVRMRVAELNVQDGRATVDLRLDHPIMPGERRLITESWTVPPGGLVTELKGGDFKRYHRVWTLRPAEEGNRTRAEFELVVQPKSIAPDWLVAIVVRRELETHFRIVKQKMLEQLRPSLGSVQPRE